MNLYITTPNPPRLKIEFTGMALEVMIQNYLDNKRFEYNLHNFVFHANGFLDYLKEKYAKVQEFKDWIKSHISHLYWYIPSTKGSISMLHEG